MLSLLIAAATVATPPTVEDVHKTIERSLPFIEKEGAEWITERKCASCHQVPFMLWSLNAADRRGVRGDVKKLAEWNTWTLDFCANNTSAKSKEKDGGGLDTAGQMLLVYRYLAPSDKQKEQLRELRQLLVKSQQKDGFWAPGGQLPGQRRPKNETTGVSTAWQIMALNAFERPENFDGIRERAAAWLSKVDTNASNEWLVVRLLLAHEFGNQEQKSLREQLLKDQNKDGGWSWLRGEKSDAFATGQSLYALSIMGGENREVIERARQFLVTTQDANGAWQVPSTKNGRPAATSTYWGTCWAVIGLCESLPTTSAP